MYGIYLGISCITWKVLFWQTDKSLLMNRLSSKPVEHPQEGHLIGDSFPKVSGLNLSCCIYVIIMPPP